MKMHELLLTEEEVLALRDAVSTETVQQRQHVRTQEKEAGPGAKRRLAVLEALLDDLKELAMR